MESYKNITAQEAKIMMEEQKVMVVDVREPDEYTVGEILRLSEGDLFPVACLAKKPNPCERCGECITLPVWEGLYRVISEYLDGMTLQDILSAYPDRSPEGGCCMDEEEQESRGGKFLP